MKKIRLGDYVTILSEPADSINRRARVEYVCQTGYYLSNMNMPFSGSLSWQFFKKSEVEK